MVDLFVDDDRFKSKFIAIVRLKIKPILEAVFNSSHGPVHHSTKEIIFVDSLITATI